MQIRNLCACVCAWGEETHQKRWIQLLLCSTRSDVHVDVHAHKSAENNRNGSRASHLPRARSESARQGTALLLLVLRSLIWCFWLRPPFGGCRSDEQRRRKRFRWTTVAGGRDLGGGLYPPVAVAPKRAWTNLGLILAEHEQRKLLPPKFGTGITPFLRVGWPFPTDSFSPQPTWSRLDGSAGNTEYQLYGWQFHYTGSRKVVITVFWPCWELSGFYAVCCYLWNTALDGWVVLVFVNYMQVTVLISSQC